MVVKTLAFVCQGNAGRSQLATALAERERDERALEVEIVTGGVDPAEAIHDEVIEVLAEHDIDISDRAPSEIRPDDIAESDYVVVMGCPVAELAPNGWSGAVEEWDLEHPHAGDLAAARAQRDEIARRVGDLFDRLTVAPADSG